MGTEIERKFLVDPALLPEMEGTYYKQDYLKTDNFCHIHVWIDRFKIGHVGIGLGPLLHFSYEIGEKDVRQLLQLAGHPDAMTDAFNLSGFLKTGPDLTARVRLGSDGEGHIAIKGGLNGISRTEVDFEIPADDAKLMRNYCPNKVEKIRYRTEYGGKEWTIDEFQGTNKGLWMAEIELESEDEAFEMPPWAGQEVSDDLRYYNVNLAVNPFSKWGNPPQKAFTPV